MHNHVHLIDAPSTEDGLSKAIGETLHHYTRYINFQKGWKGHLWQGRYSSYPMDEGHPLAAVRYIEFSLCEESWLKNLMIKGGAVLWRI